MVTQLFVITAVFSATVEGEDNYHASPILLAPRVDNPGLNRNFNVRSGSWMGFHLDHEGLLVIDGIDPNEEISVDIAPACDEHTRILSLMNTDADLVDLRFVMLSHVVSAHATTVSAETVAQLVCDRLSADDGPIALMENHIADRLAIPGSTPAAPVTANPDEPAEQLMSRVRLFQHDRNAIQALAQRDRDEWPEVAQIRVQYLTIEAVSFSSTADLVSKLRTLADLYANFDTYWVISGHTETSTSRLVIDAATNDALFLHNFVELITAAFKEPTVVDQTRVRMIYFATCTRDNDTAETTELMKTISTKPYRHTCIILTPEQVLANELHLQDCFWIYRTLCMDNPFDPLPNAPQHPKQDTHPAADIVSVNVWTKQVEDIKRKVVLNTEKGRCLVIGDSPSALSSSSEPEEDSVEGSVMHVHPRWTHVYPGSDLQDVRRLISDEISLQAIPAPAWISSETRCDPRLTQEPDHPALNRTQSVGRGMIATEDISAGTCLGIYFGKQISDAETASNDGQMVMSFADSQVAVDAMSATAGVHMINHSPDDVNCEFVDVLVDGLPVISVRATANIVRGEFLRIDYGETYFEADEEEHPVARFKSLAIDDPRYLARKVEQFKILQVKPRPRKRKQRKAQTKSNPAVSTSKLRMTQGCKLPFSYASGQCSRFASYRKEYSCARDRTRQRGWNNLSMSACVGALSLPEIEIVASCAIPRN
ncbi:SET domain [Carpediemonas membranifera]|uniref:SET domain n=1 Tax=Carpediemonas membranifera TaxID=201153 RepID=A0A8J6AR52_9EUKA|nr:SET domain [Carpediemonas membranifera]|eukprot:KAG9391813.1 SET domain [Carpediemonas membranifera]